MVIAVYLGIKSCFVLLCLGFGVYGNGWRSDLVLTWEAREKMKIGVLCFEHDVGIYIHTE